MCHHVHGWVKVTRAHRQLRMSNCTLISYPLLRMKLRVGVIQFSPKVKHIIWEPLPFHSISVTISVRSSPNKFEESQRTIRQVTTAPWIHERHTPLKSTHSLPPGSLDLLCLPEMALTGMFHLLNPRTGQSFMTSGNVRPSRLQLWECYISCAFPRKATNWYHIHSLLWPCQTTKLFRYCWIPGITGTAWAATIHYPRSYQDRRPRYMGRTRFKKARNCWSE